MDLPAINIISLCAGIAGIDLGLGLALEGARSVCFVENEVTAAEKLVARMEDGTLDPAPVWTNLKTFDGRPWRGRVHIVTAGYPCQPFSIAGKRRGAKDPRHLWPHVLRVIREVEPEIVFLENVENHLRIGYEQVRGELRGAGYAITEGIFSAQEVGATHLRKRLFVLAYRGGIERELRRYCAPGDSEAIGQVSDRGSEKRNHGRRKPGGCSPELAHRCTLFPPGPDDIPGWLDLLDRDPTLEPALCGTPDGTASRVDRLRTLGNGVVPLVAAYAFRSLARTACANR